MDLVVVLIVAVVFPATAFAWFGKFQRQLAAADRVEASAIHSPTELVVWIEWPIEAGIDAASSVSLGRQDETMKGLHGPTALDEGGREEV